MESHSLEYVNSQQREALYAVMTEDTNKPVSKCAGAWKADYPGYAFYFESKEAGQAFLTAGKHKAIMARHRRQTGRLL